MASIAPSALRQASRLASKTPSLSSSLRGIQTASRVATIPVQRASHRSYVTESKRDNAQVAEAKIETAIRLDRKQFEDAGLALGAQQDNHQTVSPMAGKHLS